MRIHYCYKISVSFEKFLHALDVLQFGLVAVVSRSCVIWANRVEEQIEKQRVALEQINET